jgi:predicted Zn-dependent protease
LKPPRAAALGALALALIAAPLNADAQRALGARPDIKTDEGGLWAMSDKAEQAARQSAQLDTAPELNTYVRDVVCRVTAEYCKEVRVYVMDRPYFNAQMAPNGYMEVWSGLLLRADNEAQLAFVLGHESGHYTQSHSLNAWRAAKDRSNAAFILSIVTAAAGVPVVGDIVYLGTVASLFGFSRDQEAQADEIGFNRAVAQGYDARAGGALWRYLVAENEHSDFDKVRKQIARGSIFATHPLTADRIEALDKLAGAHPDSGKTEEAAYRAAIRPHLGAWLKDDLRRKDFGESLFLIDHLIGRGEDLGVLYFCQGEAYRLRRKDGDLALARAAYLKAATYPDAPAAAWRELGQIYARDGDKANARAALATYLANAGEAEDKLLIEAQLKSFEGTTP